MDKGADYPQNHFEASFQENMKFLNYIIHNFTRQGVMKAYFDKESQARPLINQKSICYKNNEKLRYVIPTK